MKKIVLTIIPLLMTSACTKSNPYSLDLNVACPSGSPAIALYKHVQDEEKVEIIASDAVLAYFDTGAKDVLIAPTNAGVNKIKAGANYSLAATITFGNFFIASTGHDADGQMNSSSDYVIVFQENNVPGKLFKYVYGDLSLDVKYVADATVAARYLISGKDDDDKPVDYVFIAEPAFSNAKSQKDNIFEYANVQNDFLSKSNNLEITQASIFVNKNSDKDKIESFLKALKKDIDEFLNNPSIIDSYVKGWDELQAKTKFSATIEQIKNLTNGQNRIGLGYKKAIDNKAAIDNFLALWPAIGTTDEEIYFK